MSGEHKKKGLQCFWSVLIAPFRAIKSAVEDPIMRHARTPEIQAAALWWRAKLENATEIGLGTNGRYELKVYMALTEEELDAYQGHLAYELGKARYYCPDFRLFHPEGSECVLYLGFAACEAGVRRKINSFGWMTRMRITPERVDQEVGDFFAYGKGNWENVWMKAEAA